MERLERQFVQSNNACGKQVAEAVQDAYKRLLKPSIETEFAAQSKERADDEAIRVFAENLRQLLLASPLGQKRVIGNRPPDSAPAARWCAWMRRATCCTTRISTRIRR